MGLKEMLEVGRDTISTSIHSTPNHKTTRVQCKTMGLVLELNPNTLLLQMMTIHAWCPCLTLESLKKSRSLIMLNSLYVFKYKWVDSNIGV